MNCLVCGRDSGIHKFCGDPCTKKDKELRNLATEITKKVELLLGAVPHRLWMELHQAIYEVLKESINQP